MLGFTIVWAGQIVSVLATSMSQFALTIWAYEKTGSATALGIASAAYLVPFLALSPIAGVMVDRYNRKLMMMVSDLAAVLATAALLLIHAFGDMEMWHLYAASAVIGLGATFQWPAYSASISTMVPKKHYSRANGMMSLVESGPAVLAPILAGLLLPVVQLTGILALDVATFFLAIGALLLVHVPQPERTAEGQAAGGGLLKQVLFGFRYIFDRRGLFGLLVFFICLNFIIGLSGSLYSPFILSRTGSDSASLGAVLSAAAFGAVAGGLLVGLWGGFKRRMTSIFLGEALTGLFTLAVFGLGRGLPVWMAAAFIGGIFPVFTNGASQAIWQAKVAPDLQGRVFSARRMIAWCMGPITPVLAGALADYVTEPAMQSQGWLANVFGWMVGTGPGSGMALQFVLTGMAYMAAALICYLSFPAVRNLEDDLPDHDRLEKAAG
jgi:MFS family permease